MSAGRLSEGAVTRARRLVRAALLRYARAEPGLEEREAADRRVVVLLATAFGMGGIIRLNLNLAAYLADHRDVEIISVGRGRDRPFFGRFPDGVRVTALQDRRPDERRGRVRLAERLLRRVPSVLMHPADRTFAGWNLWVDVQLVRRLRGRAGYLVGTRPGLNLLLADLALPGFVTIGQENMHFQHHRKALRRDMRRRYPRLDALVVLTERDRATYERRLAEPTEVVRIPSTARDMGAARADLDAKVVLAAGRLSPQKGYDLLIRAWAQLADRHPDWRLRICGEGPRREELAGLVDEHGLAGSVTLEPSARDVAAEMERASIFVLSSRFEGLPITLLEAMSKGMAVASFDCPTGPSEVVDDHVTGLLAPPEDVDALAVAIGELMADEALRRRCAEAAVPVARRFTMDEVGPQWDALLDALAPSRLRLRA